MNDKLVETPFEPVLMATNAPPVAIVLHDVIEILQLFENQGRLAELEKLSKDLEDKNTPLAVLVPPNTVNAVKKFVADHPTLSGHPTGAKILGQKVGEAAAERAPGDETLIAAPRPRVDDRKCCGFSAGG